MKISSPIKEMVANHDTEEVIAWLNKSVNDLEKQAESQLGEAESAYLLGTVLINLDIISKTLKELNAKISGQKDGPVVA